MGLKFRLVIMNFLQFAVWGAYLTCIGNFLGRIGLGEYIAWFYIAQGVVSIFMPSIMGTIADKYIQPQCLLGIAHLLSSGFMLLTAVMGMQGVGISIWAIFLPYCVSVAFYMPTIALANTVAFSALERYGFDKIKDFPPIRVFGTVGFIAAMWFVNFVKIGLAETAQFTYMQLIISAVLGIVLGLYCFTLPECIIASNKKNSQKTLIQRLGLDAFVLFKQKKMAIFFLFSMLLGVSLQITNGFATPYINHFAAVGKSWFAQNPTFLISVSQICEALCLLLIPFFLKRFGIKKVMLIAMFGWVLRFGFFGIGSTESALGIVFLFLSCVVYGVAFDFFNVSGALFVEQEASKPMQANAQGLFMLMTNGIGASVGTWIAGMIVNRYCSWSDQFLLGNWNMVWFIFASYALVVAVLFAALFKYKHERK
ncbi:MAG: MFS transporter [Paludibacteraceae bacterium]|nr:MFS transporter [Paludibacteraceae bacterium]